MAKKTKPKRVLFYGDPDEAVLYIGCEPSEEKDFDNVLSDKDLTPHIRELQKIYEPPGQVSYRIVFDDAFYIYHFGYLMREYDEL